MPDRALPGVFDWDWPFSPGEGPFRIKGGSYRSHRAFVDERVPGGFGAMIERLDPRLQAFYTQNFLASGWYDLAPLVALAPICGEALGVDADQYVRMRSRYQVERDLAGVYGFFLKLVSARTIATRLPRLISLYFDFVTTHTQAVDDAQVITIQRGMPRALAPWLATVATAYLERVLEHGNTAHEVRVGEWIDEGEAHGVPVVAFSLTVRFG